MMGGCARGAIGICSPRTSPKLVFSGLAHIYKYQSQAKPFDNLNGRLGTLESATIHQTVGFTDTAKFGFKG